MLTLAAAAPRSATAWPDDGTSHEQRGLKHRPDGGNPQGPHPAPILVKMLRIHTDGHGTAPDGRLFPEPAAACSASRCTAAPGTPPAPWC